MRRNLSLSFRTSGRAFCRLSTFNTPARNVSSLRRKVRLMIISDTHGDDFKGVSQPRADVVLHCGDLTNDSRPAEFEKTMTLLRAIDAPLKLVILGNHDFSLEKGYWAWTRAGSHPARQQQDHEQNTNGHTIETEDDIDANTSWDLLRHAQQHAIFLLPQGTHTFVLPPNVGGARLRLFASPLTPRGGNWGFQYDRSNPRKWAIPPASQDEGAVDVVMTHGPPSGVRDMPGMGSHVGCAGLLAAVERSRPLVHCFGHVHAAWGAEMITWKRGMDSDSGPSAPIYDNLVDARQSRVLASLLPTYNIARVGGGNLDASGLPPKEENRCCSIDISRYGEHKMIRGRQTLFVNAAVDMQTKRCPAPVPWLVDVDLPVAGEEDAIAAAETMHWLLQ